MIVRRPAIPEDAATVARIVAEGFATFCAFAPAGWLAPERATPQNVAAIRARLWAPGAWAELAEEGGEPVGVTSFEPAADGPAQLAHLIHLFVREPWWGQGVATRLLADAVAAAQAAGFTEMRLYTVALQARARRFYAREGFQEDGPPKRHAALGLDIQLLKRSLHEPSMHQALHRGA